MTMDWWYRLNGAQQEEALAKQRKRRQRALTEQRITIPNMPPARDGIAVRVWARRRKVQPNPAPNWSLSMVMAWIIWRDFGRVKEMQEKGKVSGVAFSARIARDEASGIYVPVSVPADAFAELSQAAQDNGSVVGYIETSDGRLDTISAQLWPRLDLVDDDYRFVRSNAKFDPIFKADDVMLSWPPIDPTPWRAPLPDAKRLSRLSPPEQVARDDNIEVVGRRIIELKQQDPTITKDQIRTAIGMSKERFAAAWVWAREKNPDLQRAGRPASPKKKQTKTAA